MGEREKDRDTGRERVNECVCVCKEKEFSRNFSPIFPTSLYLHGYHRMQSKQKTIKISLTTAMLIGKVQEVNKQPTQ